MEEKKDHGRIFIFGLDLKFPARADLSSNQKHFRRPSIEVYSICIWTVNNWRDYRNYLCAEDDINGHFSMFFHLTSSVRSSNRFLNHFSRTNFIKNLLTNSLRMTVQFWGGIQDQHLFLLSFFFIILSV